MRAEIGRGRRPQFGGLSLVAAVALIGALAPLLAPDAARGQDSGIPVLTSAEAIDITGRYQLQMATSSCADLPFEADSPCEEAVPGLDWFTRRARLAAVVTISDFITAKVEPDFGSISGVVVRDAYGQLDFGEGLQLRVGQFKKPFDGFQLTSSTQILTIERDLDVPGVPGTGALSLDELTTRGRLSSYDLGVMAFGRIAGTRLRYWAGSFAGEPPEANADRNTEKQLVGRLQYDVIRGEVPLALAVAGAVTDLPFRDAEGEPEGQYYGNLELWAELGDFDRGPHVQAGYVLGENPLQNTAGRAPDPPAADLATMSTWQVIGTYKIPLPGAEHVEAIEPLFRVTRAEPNTEVGDDETWGFTPGVQVYFMGRNKFSVNWDFVAYAGDREAVNSFKSQFQVYF